MIPLIKARRAFSAGVVPPAELTVEDFRTSSASIANGASFTLTGVDIGEENPNRTIFLSLAMIRSFTSSSVNAIPTITVNDVPMSLVVTAGFPDSGSNNTRSSIFQVKIPAGTLVDVVVTYSQATVNGWAFQFFRGTGDFEVVETGSVIGNVDNISLVTGGLPTLVVATAKGTDDMNMSGIDLVHDTTLMPNGRTSMGHELMASGGHIISSVHSTMCMASFQEIV